jgi:hypothetical protein
MNILIIRAFVKLRELLATHKDLARKIEQVEASQRQQARTQAEHGSILVAVVQDIQRHTLRPLAPGLSSESQEEVIRRVFDLRMPMNSAGPKIGGSEEKRTS